MSKASRPCALSFALWFACVVSIGAYLVAPSYQVAAPNPPATCASYTSCSECVLSGHTEKNTASEPLVPGVCQWCRETGKCFNTTEEQRSLRLGMSQLEPSEGLLCSQRCRIKAAGMCPPPGLVCGRLNSCANCTNHSLCDFCEASSKCLNPCGDDSTAPITPPTPPPRSVPAPRSVTPPPVPDIVPVEVPIWTENHSEVQKAQLLVQAPATCESCVWSTPMQCKIASTCTSLKTCSACTKNRDCGWCGSHNGRCMAAVNEQPCDARNCKYWSYKHCEHACNSHSECNGCIGDKGANCAWCAGSTVGGRRTSFCGLSGAHICDHTFHNSCPNCTQIATCHDCIRTPHCGYCARANPSTSKCVEGTPSGPYDSSDCITSQDPAVGWIRACMPWNETTPILPPRAPPVSPPTAPISPPTAPVAPPIEIDPPEQTPPPTPTPPPVAPPPVLPPIPPVAPPVTTPAQLIHPYTKRIKRVYTIAIIVGSAVGAVILLIGGILWVKLHASTTHRYRAIG